MRPVTLLITVALIAGGLAGCITSSDSPPASSPSKGSALSPASAPSSPASSSSTPGPSPTAPTSSAPGATNGSANATSVAPRVVTKTWNGTITEAGQCSDSTLCFGYSGSVSPTDSNTDVKVPIEKGATGIVVVLTWPDATNDLDPAVFGPDFKQLTTPDTSNGSVTFVSGHLWQNTNGQWGQGDSPAKITIVDKSALAMVGNWDFVVDAKDAAQEPFMMKVSVYYGGLTIPTA
ncbi:MAG: hypothetical protein ACYDCK_10815 [Thermoplasmatota archaeon]